MFFLGFGRAPEQTGIGEDGDETLAQVVQRSGGCSIPGSAQGKVEWGLEQLGLVEDVPARGRPLEWDEF